MPFRKNFQREDALLSHWRIGTTLRKASLITGIPEGSVSHYYARFNKNKDKYQALVTKNGSSDPPRSSPSDITFARLSREWIDQIVKSYIEKEEYEKANQVLQLLKNYRDARNYFTTIIQNQDPKQINKDVNSPVKGGKVSPGPNISSSPRVFNVGNDMSELERCLLRVYEETQNNPMKEIDINKGLGSVNMLDEMFKKFKTNAK